MVLQHTAFHRDQNPYTRFQIWIRSWLCLPTQLNPDHQEAPRDTSQKAHVRVCVWHTKFISDLGSCRSPAPVHWNNRTVLTVGALMSLCTLCLKAFRTKMWDRSISYSSCFYEKVTQAKLMQTNLFIILQLRPATQTHSSAYTAKLSFLFTFLYP